MTILLLIAILTNVMLLDACNHKETQVAKNEEDSSMDEKVEVAKVVEEFGRKLQMVSLLASTDEVEKNMKENYSNLVKHDLIDKWVNDSLNAPGRLTSSPWPDRIEIMDIIKLSDGTYQVKGEIIEVTSEDKERGGIAAKRQITLIVKEVKKHWLIINVTLGSYEVYASIIYDNTQYGFHFYLPQSWEGYTIVSDEWGGSLMGGIQGAAPVEIGPILNIRHPQWTSDNPRQDIPIMIFTLAQWDSLQNEEIYIGAAPMGPSELGRNSKYVYALPARYNYAFPTGYEEVEDILSTNPFLPTEDIE